MKLVTASNARKHWFRLLDEVLEGEVVAIQRRGRRVVLRLEEEAQPGAPPAYDHLIRAPEADDADAWRWKWTEGRLELDEDDA